MYGDFRDLEVWRRAMRLALDCFHACKRYPRPEQNITVSQTKRAALSVPTNIAEGQGRSSKKDFLRSLSIANGELTELRSLLIFAKAAKFLEAKQADALIQQSSEVGQLLTRLRQSLRKPRHRPN